MANLEEAEKKAISEGLCPECGHKVEDGAASKHAEAHWGPKTVNADAYPDASRRQKLVREMGN